MIWKGNLFINVLFIISVYKRQQQETLWFIMVYYILFPDPVFNCNIVFTHFFVFVFIVCYMT